MKVTYEIGPDKSSPALREKYYNFYCRIRNLWDRVTSYFLRGNLDCIIPVSYVAEGMPTPVAVTFDDEGAERYEARMERFYDTYKNKKSSVLPRPLFAVEFAVHFEGGQVEPFVFHFRGYCPEKVLDFCKALEERAVYLYRHRFARPGS